MKSIKVIKRLFTGLIMFIVLTTISLSIISQFTEEWESFCSVEGHWENKYMTGKECFKEQKIHLDKYSHTSNCKRSDWPVSLSQSIFNLI